MTLRYPLSPPARAGRLFVIALILALVSGLGAPPLAYAQEAESVTLTAFPAVVEHGQPTELSGQTYPGAPGEPVQIVAEDGRVLVEVATASDGHFSASITPTRSAIVHALWRTAQSPPVAIGVRATVAARIGTVRLFDRVAVTGTLRPAHPGGAVDVQLIRNGRTVAQRRVRLVDGRAFRTRFYIEAPGDYRARATFEDADHERGSATTQARSPRTPSLSVGDTGTYVRLLERRLFRLGYHLSGRDTRFDHRTSDALIAFNKVQGRARVGSVDDRTWRALSDPIVPKPRSTARGFHIEVDQTKQVLYTVRGGRVDRILHVSTGANGYTHDGVYRVYRKLAGTSGGGLYYPSYFDGARAIHGWSSVPTYAASHGCVRVPMWAATWIHGEAVMGAEVRIYH